MRKSDSDKRDTGINNSEVDSKDWTKIKYIYKWVLYRTGLVAFNLIEFTCQKTDNMVK